MPGAHIRTLRGTVLVNGEVKQLIVDDGRFNHGYKVLEFAILSTDPTAATADSVGTLALSEDGARKWTLEDNRQIGWAGQTMISSSGPERLMGLVDPDHVVLQDLYVWGTGTTAHPGYQYFIKLQAMDISTNEAVLQLIKERSQDVE